MSLIATLKTIADSDIAAVAENLSNTELTYLDSVTAGTGAASKAMVLDANGAFTWPDASELFFGTGADAGLQWGTGDASNHSFVLFLGDSNQSLHITDKAARDTDWNVAADTHPTVYIHSNTTPATDYLLVGGHDGTTANIDVVGGTTLSLKVAGNEELSVTAAGLNVPDGSAINILGAGTGTGDIVARLGASATEGFEVRVYEATISPAAVETNALNVPAGAVLLSVQTNVETALVAGGTSVTLSIGTTDDPDKYGTHATDSLAQNQKIDTVPDWAVLGSSEQIVLTAAATGGASDGDSAFSAGAVRVRIVYLALNSLDDA